MIQSYSLPKKEIIIDYKPSSQAYHGQLSFYVIVDYKKSHEVERAGELF